LRAYREVPVEPSREELRVDLRGISYDDWLAFVFDHPVPPQGEKEWYFKVDLDVEADAGRQVAFLTRLFLEPEVVVGRYTPGQIEQGFWFMFGGGSGEWFRDPLWDPSVSREARQGCIETLPELYARLLQRCALGTIPFMLPDLLAFEYGSGFRRPEADEEDRRVQQALFTAFRRMLDSRHPATQEAALHGLHHLEHPAGKQTIRAWLDSDSNLPQEVRRYAEDVLAGRAQ
jgi:hypothetical protein